MNRVIPIITFVLRHFLMVPLAVIAGFVLWTITYVLLVVAAVVWNEDLGGVLAYPTGIIVVILAVTILGWGIFAPASAMGVILCRSLRLPRMAGIPVVFAGAFLLSHLFFLYYIHKMTMQPMPSTWIVLKNFSLFLSVPLGIYWWMTEGPGAIFEIYLRFIKNRRRARCANAQAVVIGGTE